jgi:hypothetical protein
MKEGSIFYYPTISKIMTRHRFMALIKFFHIINPTIYMEDKGLPRHDKLVQTR